MKKLCLTVVGLFILLFHAFSQSTESRERFNNGFDTTTIQYEQTTLHLEQVDLVSSYYKQNGNHSAVTGGIGSEKVTDLSNGLELKFVAKSQAGKKVSLVTGLGVDHHTAASSAWVNKSGASSTSGTRIYPSLSIQSENKKGNTWSAGTYFSGEYNYRSFGVDAGFSHKMGTGGELSAKGSVYLDQVKMILPSELIPPATYVGPTVTTTASGRRVSTSGYYLGGDDDGIPSSPRNTYTGTLSYAQVINKSLQVSGTLDMVTQQGFLSLPFHRVYDVAGTVHQEKLPDSRFKLPLGLRVNYFLGDYVIFRTFYRYYQDNWGVKAHTVSLEVPLKLSPFFSLSPFIRAYSQTASKYFAPYKVHKATDEFYTSNYAYSKLNSLYYGGGIHLSPPNGILGTALSAVDIRYAQYKQSTELNSNIISVALQWK